MKKCLITFGLSLLMSTTAAAEERWTLKEAPSGLGAKWVAEVKNPKGDTLKVYRKIGRSGYEAFAEITLASGKKFSEQMPLYQIDNGKLEDTAVIKRAGDVLNRQWADIKSNQANWRIWTSTHTAIEANSDLTPWIRGNNLLIKYKNAQNQEQKSTFTLRGSGKAIKTAISGEFQ